MPHLPALVAEKSQGPQLALGLVCTQERVEVPLDGPGPGQHSAWSSHYALAPWAVWGGDLALGGGSCIAVQGSRGAYLLQLEDRRL